jgi:hypothetical protein
MLFLCNNKRMNEATLQLRERVTQYKKRIHHLEKQIQTASEIEKKEYNFELADLKAKLTLAEAELKNTWDEPSDTPQQ